MSRTYNDPIGGTPSSVGPQLNDFYFQKKALIEARKEQYFMPLADVTAMPKNFGKTIKRYHYLPLLDDRNINDQGIDASGAVIADGNLYGSSKDIGTITGKLPVLSENGGRVNRVGFKRIEIEGTIEKFGFFDEYTQESVDFDSDAELLMHVNREMVNAAHEITEDALQIDLINGAGVIRYAGSATQNSEIDNTCEVTYGDLMRLAIDLDNNRCPKHTRVITGTRMVDTKVISAARIMYVGSELIPLLKGMTDLHGNPAFINAKHYAAAGTVLNGEIGSIDVFRIVVVPEMLKWEGAGADASTTSTHYETGNKYDVFPMLVVGDGSFTTIGFQTDGKTVKFKITHKKPGEATADRNDPYGETGFMSIKWYYGTMILRPERLALIKTAAPM
jgi:N4-gp56 family major capsid protein